MKQNPLHHILFFLSGIILIPVCAGALYSAYLQLSSAGGMERNGLVFGAGLVLYAAVHICLYRPITVHVFGHELTHVLWAWIFGGKVKQFKASKEGGRVIVTKTNFIIRLSPYFFPLYSILVICLYGLISLIAGHNRWFVYCVFTLGITTGFHFGMTLYSLRTVQTDLTASGYFFSVLFIVIMNIIILMFLLSFVMESISFLRFLKDFLVQTGRIYGKAVQAVMQ